MAGVQARHDSFRGQFLQYVLFDLSSICCSLESYIHKKYLYASRLSLHVVRHMSMWLKLLPCECPSYRIMLPSSFTAFGQVLDKVMCM